MSPQPNEPPQRPAGVGWLRRRGLPIAGLPVASVLAVSLVVFGAPALASAEEMRADLAPYSASDPAAPDAPDGETMRVAGAEPFAGSESESQSQSDPQSEPQTDAEQEQEQEQGQEAEPESDLEQETEADPQANSEQEAEPVAGAEPATPKPDPTVDPDLPVDPTSDPTSDPSEPSEPDSDATSEPESDPGSEPDSDATSEPESDPGSEPESDPVPSTGTPATPGPTPTPTPTPRSTRTPTPEVDPIPNKVRRPSAALIAERAAADWAEQERAAAVQAAAERAEAYAAARAEVESAQAALDAAKLDYASAKAEFDAALARVNLVHALAEEAAATADASRRVLAALIRALAQQQSGTATVDVLLDSQNGGNLLYQLGTLDKLAKLTGNMDAIRARAEADSARALALSEKEAAAQSALQQAPVSQTRTAMQAAEVTLAAATGRLALLSVSAPVGMAGLTPIADLRAAIPAGGPSIQGWVTPAVGSINDVFGPRPVRPVPGVGAMHSGTDLGASCGAAIYAANAGVVVAAGSAGTYGNWILVDHGNGVETGYAHVAPGQTLVAVGDAVIAGEVIAGVGSTGASTGCHLHFEVRVNGARVDPQAYLAGRGVILGR